MAAASDALAERLAGAGRVAVWATPTAETVVAVVAALRAGVPAVPLNPKSGTRELAHIVADSAPSAVLAGAGDVLPPVLAAVNRNDVDTAAAADGVVFPEPSPESPALIVYTSGTTGPPKVRSCPAARSPPRWTRWRTPGNGPATTSLCTLCRCSMCTA